MSDKDREHLPDGSGGVGSNQCRPPAAIQSDADRMNAIEEWLSRYGGWESFLDRYETNITTRTEWRPAE